MSARPAAAARSPAPQGRSRSTTCARGRPADRRESDERTRSGARGTRTPDLLGAIQALSQLSYSPEEPQSVARDQRCRGAGGPAATVPSAGKMSFRNRLRLFFAMIVVAPMVVVAIVLFFLIFGSEKGQADAKADTQRRVAQAIYNDARDRGQRAGRAIATDVPFATALRRNNTEALQTRAADLLRRQGVQRIVVARGTNRVLMDVGNAAATFPGRVRLVPARFGALEVSVITPAQYAREVKRTTGLDVAVTREGGETLFSTLPGAGKVAVPLRRDGGQATVNGR